jgi:hypothetical protein
MGIIDKFNDWRESRHLEESDGLILLSDAMKAARAVSSVPFQGYGSDGRVDTRGMYDWQMYDSFESTDKKINYARELEDFGLSRMVAAATRWVGKNLNDARFQVVQLDNDNKESEIVDHELAALFKRPNEYYGGAALLRGIALSWILKAAAYVLVLKSRAGRPVELWYEPHWTIRAVWPLDGSDFISHYEILRNGRWIPFDKDDDTRSVFVIRDGIDMASRGGIQTLESVIKDILTDEQFAKFTVQLGKYGLVQPTVFSIGDKDRPFDGNIADVDNLIQRRIASGKPIVSNDSVKTESVGLDYSKIGLGEIREFSESAFCSVVGISAESLRFSVAGKHATYNNIREHRLADYQDYIKPLHALIAEEAERQLLPDFPSKGRARCQWDYSKVEILQPNKSDDWKRIEGAYRARIIDQAEAREGIGYKFKDEQDRSKYVDVYYPVPSASITLSPIGEPEMKETMDDGALTEFGSNGGVKPS